jgi:ADP-ribose pyrophosphatase YjhB (NUDIX family)
LTEHDAAAGLRRVRCVGAVVLDDSGRLLLIQRGHEPAMGSWSVPGGRVEAGETDEQAVRREIFEETGLLVQVGPLLGHVERSGGPGVLYEIYDYDAVLAPGPASRTGVAALHADPADAESVDADPHGAVPDRAAGPGHAGDDAADLAWVTRAELDTLPLTDGLVEALTAWGRLPR